MNRLVKLAWPIVLTMTLLAAGWSISDQLIRWGMPTWLAYGISLMFDAGGLICALYAQRAVERGTSAGLSRLSIFVFAGVSALLNYHHGTIIGGRFAGIAFASTSGLVELLFELHRRDARDGKMVERGLVAEMLPRIPAMGWMMFPVRSLKTLRGAVGVRLDTLDPVQNAAPHFTLTREELHADEAPQSDEAPHPSEAPQGLIPVPEYVLRALAAVAGAPAATVPLTLETATPIADAPSEAAAQISEAPVQPASPQPVAAPASLPVQRPAAPAVKRSAAPPALHLTGLTKAAAVRVVREALPAASPAQIALHLEEHGIAAEPGYIRTVLSRDTRPKGQTPGNGGYL